MPSPIMPHHPDSPEALDTSCACGGKGNGACGTKDKQTGCGCCGNCRCVKRCGFCPLTSFFLGLLTGGAIVFVIIKYGVLSF
jgi:hypothetical protein